MHNWTEQQASEILLNEYLIDGTVQRVDGEYGGTFHFRDTAGMQYLVKVTPDAVDHGRIELENVVLSKLEQNGLDVATPRLIPNRHGQVECLISGGILRVFSWIDGRMYAHVNPRTSDLRYDLGRRLGEVKKVLLQLSTPEENWSFDWSPHNYSWIENALDVFNDDDRTVITSLFTKCKAALEDRLNDLPWGVNYNDANDYNIVVSNDPETPRVLGFIDFGDVQCGPAINDLAICLTYAMMDCDAPLDAAFDVVKGYHSVTPLSERDLAVLMPLAIARLLISYTKARQRAFVEPDNTYWQISARPAWKLLRQLQGVSLHFAQSILRSACDYEPCPKHAAVCNWLTGHQQDIFPVLGFAVEDSSVCVFDWSAGSPDIPNLAYLDDIDSFTVTVFDEMQQAKAAVGIGRYDEPRLVYTTEEYNMPGDNGPRSRTIHIGLDLFMPAGTPLYAPLDGTVQTIVNDAGDKEYGPLLILKHQVEGLTFFTLYGHNSIATLEMWAKGDRVKKGDKIAEIGDYPENGNWVPHSHFQIITDLLDYSDDFPGVADPVHRTVWKSICPDPNLIMGFDSKMTTYQEGDVAQLLAKRKQLIGPNLSVSYGRPLHIVRGWQCRLFTSDGRSFLDTRNNIAHVGHEHPHVTAAGIRQMAVVNTNTRYLHHVRLECAARLLATLPDQLKYIYFVNSGSEANDLALRIARQASGSQNVAVLDQAYHGHTQAVLDVSPYKFKGKGGFSCPPHVTVLSAPDTFRGEFAHARDGDQLLISNALQTLNSTQGPLTFLHESLPSCAGQLEPPKEYFKSIYRAVRDRGGVCIADEVQTGMGRVGAHYWAFQLYDVLPDIVTIGKPLGNGHPVAAVAVSEEMARAFDNGMEYFNSFGGNPVSCAVAKAVMDVIDTEGLQQAAFEVGGKWKASLQELALAFPVMADVRGHGLFLGVEFCEADKVPATKKAAYVSRRMLDHRILTSFDGPDENVMKIKPPMCIAQSEVDQFMAVLHKILQEDMMAI